MKRNLLDVSWIEDFDDEVIETLAVGNSFQLKRIVSSGQTTPEGEWYDQPQDEWVVLLSGSARILFQGLGQTVELQLGDFVNIRAHQKHRVVYTDLTEKTVWLALYFDSDKS